MEDIGITPLRVGVVKAWGVNEKGVGFGDRVDLHFEGTFFRKGKVSWALVDVQSTRRGQNFVKGCSHDLELWPISTSRPVAALMNADFPNLVLPSTRISAGEASTPSML